MQEWLLLACQSPFHSQTLNQPPSRSSPSMVHSNTNFQHQQHKSSGHDSEHQVRMLLCRYCHKIQHLIMVLDLLVFGPCLSRSHLTSSLAISSWVTCCTVIWASTRSLGEGNIQQHNAIPTWWDIPIHLPILGLSSLFGECQYHTQSSKEKSTHSMISGVSPV